jgi:predicted lipoprotein with Yx(FWY)xxD motif
MQKTIAIRGSVLLVAALLFGLVAAIYATRSSGASATRARVVMTSKNSALHKTILVNRAGMSLYSLSVERHGKFICTNSACVSLWHPLTVAKGTTPTGVKNLTTVKRPDGKLQVAYKGAPLYSFANDHKRGDVKGNGFKDVGVWRVAVLGKTSSSSSSSSSGGTYTYPNHY